ncbi:hypothetical protein TNCV_3259191 [Trichonephila clavipes]|nr:hypothetical protein TNCV_3259191 [Trichonephila clavipes]
MTLQKDLAGMHPLCMIFGSSGEGMVLPHEDRFSGVRGITEKEDCRIRRMAFAHRTAFVAEIRAAIGNTTNC